jgi:hypothetical protein
VPSSSMSEVTAGYRPDWRRRVLPAVAGAAGGTIVGLMQFAAARRGMADADQAEEFSGLVLAGWYFVAIAGMSLVSYSLLMLALRRWLWVLAAFTASVLEGVAVLVTWKLLYVIGLRGDHRAASFIVLAMLAAGLVASMWPARSDVVPGR